MKRLFLGLALFAAMLAWRWPAAPAPSPPGESQRQAPAPALLPEAARQAPLQARAVPPETGASTPLQAQVPLADPARPPLARRPPVTRPSSEVLADPDTYLEWENDAHRALLRAFVAAARKRIPELERLVERGRAEGLPPQTLQEGIDKVEALKKVLADTERQLTP
ncbi:hypothetical protein [Gallaecimonas sp. GXIMD4217]|uniref:hypothetical protein n=1 Tax=Gallaecimonas sp. GXIMD4217 TaxID=3131927 RepID=UPI00311AE18E